MRRLQDIILWACIHGMKFGYAIVIIITAHSVIFNNGLTGLRGLKAIWFGLILMGVARVADKWVKTDIFMPDENS